MSTYLFDTVDFYDHEYICNDIIKFKELIFNIESGIGPKILDEYIESKGKISDICIMYRYGNGEKNVVWIGKSIIIGGNLDTLKKLIELDKLQINKQYNEYDSFDSNWASEIESINPSGQSQGNEEVDKYKTTSFWEVIKDIFK